ncbi:MAG: signal peptidase I [Verrucomicrobia bacterium]|nr:signal peptidase I [Verrucomicrobiota bacterium]
MSAVFAWLTSTSIRQATDLRKHVLNLLAAQRDLLAPEGITAIEAACAKLRTAVGAKADKKALMAEMTAVETVANQWLKPHPHAGWRENIEVVLVAIGVAMAIRTFFLQPFKIPTGSMQPTLYGITHESSRNQAEVKFPGALDSFVDSWFRGVTYYHVVCEADGELHAVEQPKTVIPLLVKKQRFQVGERTYTVWFPPDQLFGGNANRSGLYPGQQFRKGEDILKLKVTSGDHLFVDRLSYNFRRPERGEIIVFETKGIEGLPQDQFYIKRMVALGGERVSIGDDRHLRINGQRLDASTPRFENVYHLSGPPDDSKFSGHVNERVAQQNRGAGLAPLFSDERHEFTLRQRHYMVMGDNTMNSLDSRRWGDFAQENVIGKSAFVYWPFLNQGNRPGRFGWSHR